MFSQSHQKPHKSSVLTPESNPAWKVSISHFKEMDFGAFWGLDVQIFVFEGQVSSFFHFSQINKIMFLIKWCPQLIISMNFLTLLCLSPFINGWIHYLMGYPIKTPLYQLVEAFWRAGAQGPGPGPRDPRAKMLRPLDKGASLLDIPLNNGFNRW